MPVHFGADFNQVSLVERSGNKSCTGLASNHMLCEVYSIWCFYNILRNDSAMIRFLFYSLHRYIRHNGKGILGIASWLNVNCHYTIRFHLPDSVERQPRLASISSSRLILWWWCVSDTGTISTTPALAVSSITLSLLSAISRFVENNIKKLYMQYNDAWQRTC